MLTNKKKQMGKNKRTITGGMGLENSFSKFAEGMIMESLEETSYVSDALLNIAERVREDSLGEVNNNLSEYEKKLIFIGFVAGEMRASSQIAEQLEMLQKLSGMKGFMDAMDAISQIKKQKGED